MTALLAVGDLSDEVIVGLRDVATNAGVSFQISDFLSASRVFSITVDGPHVEVEPDCPMFLRSTWHAGHHQAISADAAFLRGESFSTIWAAGALMRSPVINRPGAHGISGLCAGAGSPLIAEFRAGLLGNDVEKHASTLPVPPQTTDDEWWIEDLGTFDVAQWPKSPVGEGPFRGRPIRPSESYEVVTVVADEAWRLTAAPVDHLPLEQLSLSAANRLGLTFASFFWAIDKQMTSTRLAKVDPYPRFEDLQPNWIEISHALLRNLTG